MDNNGLLAAAGALAYFTLVKQIPLGVGHPLTVVTAIGCYAAVPYVYLGVVGEIAVADKNGGLLVGAMAPKMMMAAMPLAGAGVAYGVARFMNI
jgi:hypothetical protein